MNAPETIYSFSLFCIFECNEISLDMLTFNHSGLLVPDNKIINTALELENEFVSKLPGFRRREIFDSYVKYNDDFKNVCDLNELHQWVNGSFVTKKKIILVILISLHF